MSVGERILQLQTRPGLRRGARVLQFPASAPAGIAEDGMGRFVAHNATVLLDGLLLAAVAAWARALEGPGMWSTGLFAAVLFLLTLFTPHHDSLNKKALDDFGPLLRQVITAYGFVTFLLVLTEANGLRPMTTYALVSTGVLLSGRVVARWAQRSAARSAAPARTLVIGAGDIGRRVVSTLDRHREYGFDVVGVVDDDPKFCDELSAPLLGGLPELGKLVRKHAVDNVIVTFSSADQAGMVDGLRGLMQEGVVVWVIPRFFELATAKGPTDHIWGLPIVRMATPARHRPAWVLKRALDVVVSAAGLVIAAPVMGVVAVATLIDSGRPILHRQTRLSLDGRSFEILKFRSMTNSTEAKDTEWAPAEARITRLGAILRKTSLDELPQLFNVLRGEMSLVGPRPERPYFVSMFREQHPNYDGRHRLPAGITGWAQIHGLRGDTSIDERCVFDNFYVENWSLGQDLKILIRTVPAMLGGDPENSTPEGSSDGGD